MAGMTSVVSVVLGLFMAGPDGPRAVGFLVVSGIFAVLVRIYMGRESSLIPGWCRMASTAAGVWLVVAELLLK